jgi:two-component system, OmpR family, phosphate regulon sensor histidine kinase PhoR
VRRSVFRSVFLRIATGLVLVALAGISSLPNRWIIAGLLATAWAGISAFFLARSVRQDVTLLQNSAAAIPERQVEEITSSFSDFDGLARAISVSSVHVNRSLSEASESRHELEAMIDSMQDAVVAVDPAGRIQWTNQRMQKLIPGASFSSAIRIGHALVQTIRDPEILGCVRTALEQRVVSDGRSTSLLPGRIYEVNVSPMPGGGAVAVLHDITRIEQVERTQRDFVANVSHELRTPLTSITGYVETLLDHEASLSQSAREFLTIILKNATRMNRLTEDLLVMARVESSEQELHPAPIPADILVRDAVQAMSGLVQDTESILEIGNISTAEVFADNDAILQVLSNLIENGIKYGQARNAPVCKVIVSSRDVSDPIEAVEFSVRDFGPGIASEHLGRIFERFYRVDKARSRESGGTGLGLAIARHMVQTHGGSIRAESELNAGSNFIFTLPKAQNLVE